MKKKHLKISVRKKTMILLITTTFVYITLLIPASLSAPLSIMAFDAPNSQKSILTWIFVSSFISLPLFLIIATIVPWILYFNQRIKPSIYLSLLPLINLVIILTILMFPK